jgi:hypothetical protein
MGLSADLLAAVSEGPLSSSMESSKARDDRNPNQFGPTTEARTTAKLADGTRQDIRIQNAKGLRIATRCSTVEQFIAAFFRFCEDTSIFIPNASRPVGAVTEFSFDLQGGRSAFAGVGAVIEDLSTTQNRYGQTGIVVALQQLWGESSSVFERALAARAPSAARTVPEHTPAPTRTGLDATDVRIPSTADRAVRAKTVIGLPTISKLPAASPIKVPVVIAPRQKPAAAKTVAVKPAGTQAAAALHSPKVTPVAKPAVAPIAEHTADTTTVVDRVAKRALSTVADAVPVPIMDSLAPELDGVADAIPETLPENAGDTIRDEVPFALLHNLGNAPAVVLAPEPAVARAPEPTIEPTLAEPAILTAPPTAALLAGNEPGLAIAPDSEVAIDEDPEVALACEPLVAAPAAVAPAMVAPEIAAVAPAMFAPAIAPVATAEVVDEAPPMAAPAELLVQPIEELSASSPEPEQDVRPAGPWRRVAMFAAAAVLFLSTAAVTLIVREPSWAAPSPRPETAQATRPNTLQAALSVTPDPASAAHEVEAGAATTAPQQPDVEAAASAPRQPDAVPATTVAHAPEVQPVAPPAAPATKTAAVPHAPAAPVHAVAPHYAAAIAAPAPSRRVPAARKKAAACSTLDCI